MTIKDYDSWDKSRLVEELKRVSARKKYGLVWEEKPEDVVEQCKTELPVLQEVADRALEIDQKLPTHFIIEGDNYHALSVLNYTHAGKVDVIYIDPPYNTGARDWKYNNDYIDTNDTYRHSKWLAMMEHRLTLAKNLLKSDGVLVVAIDDNEVHRLRLLIEEVMPTYDISSVTVVQNPRGNITNNFARTHEYALFVIPKGIKAIGRTKRDNATPRKMRRWGHNSTREARPTMFYPIYVRDGSVVKVGKVPPESFHPKSKNILVENGEIEVWPIDQNGVERRWNFGIDKVAKEFGRILAIEKDGEVDLFLSQEDTTTKTVWTDSEFEAGRNGATLVRNITGVDFPYPKSIFTVQRCLELLIQNKKQALVIDFFAGSGTTGHAVLLINEEDGGSRKFILCTNNENSIAEEVTYPRIKNVIEGYADIDGIPANLRYFKTAFVPKSEVSDDTRRALIQKSTEMLCLKESTFKKAYDNKKFKIYHNINRATGILFDLDALGEFKERIKSVSLPANIYVFSLTSDNFSEDFDDVDVVHHIRPIPEGILEVYRKIFA